MSEERRIKYSPLKIDENQPSKPSRTFNPKICAIVTVLCFTLFLIGTLTVDAKSKGVDVLYMPIPERSQKLLDQRFTYKCKNNLCQREKYTSGRQVSLNTCNMVCDKPQIWPIPKKLRYSDTTASFFKGQITFHSQTINEQILTMLHQAYSIFYRNLDSLNFPVEEWVQTSDVRGFISVNVSVESGETKLRLETDESYTLSVKQNIELASINVTIKAKTYYGARHGLETLLQLIWWDEFENGGMLRMLTEVNIEDAPKFPHRGIMVDTARNYFPIKQLQEVVQGMSASKLNTLHLHLTDAVSFSIQLPSVENLSLNGAYSPEKIYTVEEIDSLIEYAKIRGVRVILEVDAPSHVNSGWQSNEEGEPKLVICGENDVTRGHLNPDEPKALDTLQSIYHDLLNLMKDDQIFHIGNDEVDLNCWSKTDSAINHSNLKSFWANYTSQMIERLKIANNGSLPENIVMWSSPLTASTFLDLIQGAQNITIQFWLGSPTTFLRNKHKVIFSTVSNWYLDCGFGMWNPHQQTGVCDPYRPWQTVYGYRPWVEFSCEDLTLGGEVCLWSEQVSTDALHTRLWPRATAFAERIWSDPPATKNNDVYTRLVTQSNRLVARGLPSSAIWPEWCSNNPGKC